MEAALYAALNTKQKLECREGKGCLSSTDHNQSKRRRQLNRGPRGHQRADMMGPMMISSANFEGERQLSCYREFGESCLFTKCEAEKARMEWWCGMGA